MDRDKRIEQRAKAIHNRLQEINPGRTALDLHSNGEPAHIYSHGRHVDMSMHVGEKPSEDQCNVRINPKNSAQNCAEFPLPSDNPSRNLNLVLKLNNLMDEQIDCK